jgi:thiol-disulfide isomerase/thioredoxin
MPFSRDEQIEAEILPSTDYLADPPLPTTSTVTKNSRSKTYSSAANLALPMMSANPFLHNHLFVIVILVLAFVANSDIATAESITVPVSNGEEVPIERFAASGDSVIIWTPSDFGIQPPQGPVALSLAKQGIEVWIADLHTAYFVPTGRFSSNSFPVADVGLLVDAAVARGKRNIILASSGRATRLLLRGARDWQSSHPDQSSIRGFILFHPSLYLDQPRLGEDAEYLPIARSTNLPIYIFQPLRSATYMRLPGLRTALGEGGATVFVHPLPDVAVGFHLRPDEDISAQDRAARQQLPDNMVKAVKLLTLQPPVARAAKESAQVVAKKRVDMTSGLKIFEKPFDAPAFSLENMSGQRVSLDQYRGKVVLLNFWASWCPPCLEEMPSMQRLYQRLTDKPFEILAIDVGENREDVLKFTNMMKTTFPVLLDRDGSVFNEWKVYVYPTNFLIDKKGRIRYGSPGAINWDEKSPVEKIEQLLNEK